MKFFAQRRNNAPPISKVIGSHFSSRSTIAVLRFHAGLAFLQKHCYAPIQVGDVVKATALSRRGLYKTFQKFVGRSPGYELRRLRIEGAKKLLDDSNHNLKTIAKMCGFRSENSFFVAFRSATGISPGKYRAANSRRKTSMPFQSAAE